MEKKSFSMRYFCRNVKKPESMSKAFIFTLSVVIFWYGCNNLKDENIPSFTMNMEIIGSEDGTPVYLQRVQEGELETLDSTMLTDTHAVFKGSLDQPEIVYVKIGDSRKLVNLFAENSQIFIRAHIDSLDQVKISGSSVHDDLTAFMKYMEPVNEKSSRLMEEYRYARSDRKNEIVDDFDDLQLEQTRLIKEFVLQRPKSYISPFIIRRYLAIDMEYTELNELVSALDSVIHNSEDYQMLSNRVEALKYVAIGMPAVDFALNDTTGNPIAISSFRGKVLLIDFWASWCKPCREENPRVVQLYNDFKDKGFEIIGVSFDENKEKWIDAIQKDNLNWPHISDLKGWGSDAAKLYMINAIPATVLLNREGTIIAKNLRGDDLRKKLEELYAAEDQNS